MKYFSKEIIFGCYFFKIFVVYLGVNYDDEFKYLKIKTHKTHWLVDTVGNENKHTVFSQFLIPIGKTKIDNIFFYIFSYLLRNIKHF